MTDISKLRQAVEQAVFDAAYSLEAHHGDDDYRTTADTILAAIEPIIEEEHKIGYQHRLMATMQRARAEKAEQSLAELAEYRKSLDELFDERCRIADRALTARAEKAEARLEYVRRNIGSCHCNEGYVCRGKVDPHCLYHASGIDDDLPDKEADDE